MKIRFVSPPPAKQAGGIRNAIAGMRVALEGTGAQVIDGCDLGDRDAIHHFHGLWNPRHTWWATRLRARGMPYVVSPHGMMEPWAFRHRAWKKRPYFHAAEKPMMEGAAAIFVTSAMEARHLSSEIQNPRIATLPLGSCDPLGPARQKAREELGWPADQKVMLFLSRIDRKKGLDLLLQALAGTPGAPSWKLVIVGDGDPAYTRELQHLEELLHSKLPEVEWTGAIWGPERWAYLQAADLFCLPTHSENFGIAVLEALHAGTPVLTTDQTPWVDHREQAGIFIARPEIASLRNGLSEALPYSAAQWGDENRQKLAAWTEECFGWAHLALRYAEAYRTAGLLARGGFRHLKAPAR